MPGMEGYKLARRIRERKDLSRVNLVAMTGCGQPSDREMAFRAGFDHHLTKPVALQRLRELLDELEPGPIASKLLEYYRNVLDKENASTK